MSIQLILKKKTLAVRNWDGQTEIYFVKLFGDTHIYRNRIYSRRIKIHKELFFEEAVRLRMASSLEKLKFKSLFLDDKSNIKIISLHMPPGDKCSFSYGIINKK